MSGLGAQHQNSHYFRHFRRIMKVDAHLTAGYEATNEQLKVWEKAKEADE
jgi:hypothetical protein